MRGEIQHVNGVQQAIAVLDLVLGGVKAEMANDKFDWLAVPAPKQPMPAVVNEAPKAPALQVALPRAAEKPVPVKPMPKVEIPAETWTEGDSGGVLLLVQGGKPDSRAVALAKAMLLAAGVQDMPVGWVGYTGAADGKLLRAAMQGQSPQQVLVLGQAPLGVLLGRNLGVEGWHAAGGQKIEGWDGVPVGVTYPLELLMKQPLFKRLAWQHLLAWGDGQQG